MKYTIAIAALVAAVSAQDPSISACPAADSCILDAIANSGVCQAKDWSCACQNLSAIQGSAAPCVLSACGDKAVAVLGEVQQICSSISSGGGAAGAAPGEAGAPADATAASPEASASAPAASAPEESTSAAAPAPGAATPTADSGADSGAPTEAAAQPTNTFAQAGAASLAPATGILVALAAFLF